MLGHQARGCGFSVEWVGLDPHLAPTQISLLLSVGSGMVHLARLTGLAEPGASVLPSYGTSVRMFPERMNSGGMIHPKCRQHYPTRKGPGLSKQEQERASWAPEPAKVNNQPHASTITAMSSQPQQTTPHEP